MELILLQKVRNLGTLGDKVVVKPGYGRNFLLPQGKAIIATTTCSHSSTMPHQPSLAVSLAEVRRRRSCSEPSDRHCRAADRSESAVLVASSAWS